MLKVNHRIYINGELDKQSFKEEFSSSNDIIEFQLQKILTELKSKKVVEPLTPCIEENINLVVADLKNYKNTFIDKRKIFAGDRLYEYRINSKNNRMHFYKRRDNGKYISIRDYFITTEK